MIKYIYETNAENMEGRIKSYNAQDKYSITMKYIENLIIKISRNRDY